MAKTAATLQQARQHFEAGRLEQARILLMRALQKQPGDPGLSNGLATVLSAMGQFEQAIFHARRAAEGVPPQPGPYVNLGNCLLLLGQVRPAEEAFQRALSLAPEIAEPRLGLANIYRMRHEFHSAIEVLAPAAAQHPDDPDVALHYASSLLHMGRTDEAVACAQRVLRARPGQLDLQSRLANALNYAPVVSPEDVFEAHRQYGLLLESAVPPLPPARMPVDPERPLRLGILSHDLRRHSVAFFLEPLMTGIDRKAFTLCCYSTSPMEDDVTERLAARADVWRRAATLDDRKLAAQIRSDGVDVLIETSGHTHGHRLAVLAMRPAPLQATFIGYPNTTGLSRVDLRIADSTTDPPGAEQYCTEHLVRLDPCFLCYAPPAQAPDIEPLPCAGGKPVTFGSFNTMQKVNREVIATWLRLLGRVDGSRLLLKALDFREAPVREAVLRLFVDAGGDAARITLLPPGETYAEHLGAYAQVDIALDTFPYAGTTTTFEALWMGVPVVTLQGRGHAGRVGASILAALGLRQFIAASPDEYIEHAASLAGDVEALKSLRATLRDRLAASVLCDAAGYAKRFEHLVREAWRDTCRKEDSG